MRSLCFVKMAPDPLNPVFSDWIRVGQICLTLDISVRTLNRILERFPFTEKETTFVSEMTEGGRQMVRVFSRRGALKLAMLSDSPKRGEVATAIFDLAERGNNRGLAAIIAAGSPPTSEVLQILDEVERLWQEGELTVEVIEELRTGKRAPAPEESMIAMADEWEVHCKAIAAGNAGLRELDKRAIRCGYAEGAVKRFVRRRRKMQQPQLSFGEEATDGS